MPGELDLRSSGGAAEAHNMLCSSMESPSVSSPELMALSLSTIGYSVSVLRTAIRTNEGLGRAKEASNSHPSNNGPTPDICCRLVLIPGAGQKSHRLDPCSTIP